MREGAKLHDKAWQLGSGVVGGGGGAGGEWAGLERGVVRLLNSKVRLSHQHMRARLLSVRFSEVTVEVYHTSYATCGVLVQALRT